MKLRKNWLNLRLFVILHYLLDLTKGVNGTTNSTNQNDNSAYFTSQMLTGVLAGVGFFIGMIILVCVTWQCCCGDGCDGNKSATKKKAVMKKRVGPSPPRSEPATRSTTAESRRISVQRSEFCRLVRLGTPAGLTVRPIPKRGEKM